MQRGSGEPPGAVEFDRAPGWGLPRVGRDAPEDFHVRYQPLTMVDRNHECWEDKGPYRRADHKSAAIDGV
ncbi:hypothetical protein GCM10010324_06720 [Streptomyces hiroshimensis]|uniref:Uncharacterized protein n=1 Tax=Streptomyces hiroshimensis TaxID=66424 RepID=A0ABQ2Y4I6_9ACTN|nr:hypothetical protein GCM10010324_06720 [Streptomyces hiroshimensis]